MQEFFAFFVVLLAGVFFSGLFNRLHLPWVVALIVGGMVIGPNGLNFFTPNSVTDFLSQVGLIFLMFMAGLEINLPTLKENIKSISVFSVVNGIIPFGVGFAIGHIFDMGFLGSMLLGTIFISTSIGVVIPMLERTGVAKTKIGKVLIGGTMTEDIVSLILLSTLLQTLQPVSNFPLPVFYLLLFLALFLLRMFIPPLKLLASKVFSTQSEEDLFQQDLRVIFALLIGIVIFFEFLGLHPIVAGFFAGFVLSDSIQSDTLMEKIRAISYGIFIPIFFITIGTNTNLGVLSSAQHTIGLTVALVGGSMISKYVSGFLGAKAIGWSTRQGVFAGLVSIPQLTTTLAVAYTGTTLGLFDDAILTAMIILSAVTTLVSPILINQFRSFARG